MKLSLIVKAAIEAHIRRMPRRLSGRGKMGRSFVVRSWVSDDGRKGKCPRWTIPDNLLLSNI
jgi:hypothetical protein